MSTMTEKRSALAAYILSTLEALQDSNRWRVDERLREAVLGGRGRPDRLEVMGNPARYVLVMPVAIDFVDDPRRRSGTGAPYDRGDTFSVQLWYGYYDGKDYASSSQYRFDRIVDGSGSLIATLADSPWLEGAGELGDPVGASLDLVELAPREMAHYMSFNITII